MCVASLHATSQHCAHRWYQLVRSCHPDTDLQNCPSKLKLAGWENRTDACPWCDCDVATPNDGSFKLFGNPTTGISTPASNSLELGSTPPHRVDSWGTLSSLSTLSRHTSVSSTESNAGQRHREMNERLQVYLNAKPHDILPSALKNYPTYSQSQDVMAHEETEGKKSVSKDAVTRRIKKRLRLGLNRMSLDLSRP